MSGLGMKNICDYSFAGVLKNGLKVYLIILHLSNQLSKHAFNFSGFFRPLSEFLILPIHGCLSEDLFQF